MHEMVLELYLIFGLMRMLMVTIENLSQEIPLVDHSPNNFLDDLLRVGSNKPMGYLANSHLLEDCKVDKQKVIEYLEETGRKVLNLDPKETWVIGGAIFVYDRNSLQKLILNNKKILEKNDWPTEVEEFVRKVAIDIVDRKKNFELFSLIALVFDDYENIVRGDISDLIRIMPIIMRKLREIFKGSRN